MYDLNRTLERVGGFSNPKHFTGQRSLNLEWPVTQSDPSWVTIWCANVQIQGKNNRKARGIRVLIDGKSRAPNPSKKWLLVQRLKIHTHFFRKEEIFSRNTKKSTPLKSSWGFPHQLRQCDAVFSLSNFRNGNTWLHLISLLGKQSNSLFRNYSRFVRIGKISHFPKRLNSWNGFY